MRTTALPCRSAGMVQLLVSAGAHVNIVDGSGRTPLHLAVARSHDGAVVEALLQDWSRIKVEDADSHALELQPALFVSKGTSSAAQALVDVLAPCREHGKSESFL